MHWYVIEILYRFYKKVFVVPKYPSPLKPYPFCVCFTVFYILNRQTEWNETESVVCFLHWRFVAKQKRLENDLKLTSDIRNMYQQSEASKMFTCSHNLSSFTSELHQCLLCYTYKHMRMRLHFTHLVITKQLNVTVTLATSCEVNRNCEWVSIW